jgi:hypothetical protein
LERGWLELGIHVTRIAYCTRVVSNDPILSADDQPPVVTMELAELIERPIVVLALAVSLLVAYAIFFKSGDGSARVPWAETSIPFLGGVVDYGEDPVRFLVEQRKKVGDVFRVNLLVMKITFVIGSEVSVRRGTWPNCERPRNQLRGCASGTSGCYGRRTRRMSVSGMPSWPCTLAFWTRRSTFRDGSIGRTRLSSVVCARCHP